MSASSIIFFLIFLLPLTALLIWVMSQDKRRAKTGIFVLTFIVIIGIIFMYMMTRGK